MSIAFLVTALIIVVTPGTGALYTISTGLGVFMVMTLVVFAVYGLFASAVRRHLIERPRIVRRMRQVFAASFVGLSAKLALTAR